MSQDKSVLIGAVLAKIDATYGAGGAVTAGADAQQLMEPMTLAPRYVFDGAREPQIGAIGPFARVAPSGKYWEGTARFRPRGNNSTYTASVFPLDTHVFLRAAAHDSAFSATKHTYTPSAGPATGYASLVMEAYARGQKYPLKGIYCDFNIIGENPGIPVFEFPFMAVPNGAVTDAQPPAITYNTAAIPPKCTGMTFSIGNYLVGRIKRFEFNKQHQRVVRASFVDGATVVGFAYDRFDPRLKVTLEATALATTPFHQTTGLDPLQLIENATQLAIAIQCGSAGQSLWKLNLPQATTVDMTENNDGPVATWELEFQASPSSPTALDHYNMVFGA